MTSLGANNSDACEDIPTVQQNICLKVNSIDTVIGEHERDSVFMCNGPHDERCGHAIPARCGNFV
jgi:hypothetical protein